MIIESKGHHSVVLALAVFVGAAANAQAWEAVPVSDFLAAKRNSDAKYKELSRFEMSIELASFRSFEDAAPFERMTAVVLRDGDRFRTEMGSIVTIQGNGVRVIMDKEDRSVLATNPVDMAEPWIIQAVDIVLGSISSCLSRDLADGVEYKLVYRVGSTYEHTLVRYDTNGWLKGTSTIWAIPVAEDPSNLLSARYRPRLDVRYGVPVLFDNAKARSTDPWNYVQEHSNGLFAIGDWKGSVVTDARYQP